MKIGKKINLYVNLWMYGIKQTFIKILQEKKNEIR